MLQGSPPVLVTLDGGQAVIAYELQKDPFWNPPM